MRTRSPSTRESGGLSITRSLGADAAGDLDAGRRGRGPSITCAGGTWPSGRTTATARPSWRNIRALAGMRTAPAAGGRSKRHLGVVAGLQRAVGVVDLQLDQQAPVWAPTAPAVLTTVAVKVRPGYSRHGQAGGHAGAGSGPSSSAAPGHRRAAGATSATVNRAGSVGAAPAVIRAPMSVVRAVTTPSNGRDDPLEGFQRQQPVDIGLGGLDQRRSWRPGRRPSRRPPAGRRRPAPAGPVQRSAVVAASFWLAWAVARSARAWASCWSRSGVSISASTWPAFTGAPMSTFQPFR